MRVAVAAANVVCKLQQRIPVTVKTAVLLLHSAAEAFAFAQLSKYSKSLPHVPKQSLSLPLSSNCLMRHLPRQYSRHMLASFTFSYTRRPPRLSLVGW